MGNLAVTLSQLKIPLLDIALLYCLCWVLLRGSTFLYVEHLVQMPVGICLVVGAFDTRHNLADFHEEPFGFCDRWLAVDSRQRKLSDVLLHRVPDFNSRWCLFWTVICLIDYRPLLLDIGISLGISVNPFWVLRLLFSSADRRLLDRKYTKEGLKLLVSESQCLSVLQDLI